LKYTKREVQRADEVMKLRRDADYPSPLMKLSQNINQSLTFQSLVKMWCVL
jgi:hypothetical protein